LACFRALASQAGIDLTVAFLLSHDPRWPWGAPPSPLGFRHLYLDAQRPKMLALLRLVRKSRPHVVIVGGWDHTEYLAASALQRLAGFEVILWSESTALDWRRQTTLREKIKQRLIRNAGAVVVPGRAAERYARTLGATTIITAPNACEVAVPLADDAGNSADRRWDGVSTVLFVGRLASEKGVDVLLRAWRQVASSSPSRLVIIGSGPEDAQLKKLAFDLNVTNIEWLPFGEPSQVQRWYRRAQILVLPSRSEPWGFVINEAMAANLPVIASSVCGAAVDLIEDGVTGWIVPPEDADGLARCIQHALTDSTARSAIAAAAAERITSYTPTTWAEGMAYAVSSAAGRTGHLRQR
jgi:glycosyltransferase involved in cell wall biosynthesis